MNSDTWLHASVNGIAHNFTDFYFRYDDIKPHKTYRQELKICRKCANNDSEYTYSYRLVSTGEAREMFFNTKSAFEILKQQGRVLKPKHRNNILGVHKNGIYYVLGDLRKLCEKKQTIRKRNSNINNNDSDSNRKNKQQKF